MPQPICLAVNTVCRDSFPAVEEVGLGPVEHVAGNAVPRQLKQVAPHPAFIECFREVDPGNWDHFCFWKQSFILDTGKWLIFNAVRLPESCRFWRMEVLCFQIPRHCSFHGLRHAAGQTNWSAVAFFAFFIMGTMTAYRRICGSSPCSQMWLKIWRSFHNSVLPRWISISLVMPSGPGDFLGFSFFRTPCSSPRLSGCCMGFTMLGWLFPLSLHLSALKH